MILTKFSAFLLLVCQSTAFTFQTPQTMATTEPKALSSTTLLAQTMANTETDRKYSMANQEERFSRAKEENNQRYLDITTVYDPSRLKGLRVVVTGANKGNGLALSRELKNAGAHVIAVTRSTSDELEEVAPQQLIKDIDVTDDEVCANLADKIEGGPVDMLINNAGYFPKGEDDLTKLKFDKELLAIDICAVGPLRISANLINAGLLKKGSKIINITSQGGSVAWREVQNPDGADYGHHMSKAAANMMSMLLKKQVEDKGIMIGVFHPGFNKTGMTKDMEEIWEREGAVDPSVGAKRILYEALELTPEKSGTFRNCEDGLEIPW